MVVIAVAVLVVELLYFERDAIETEIEQFGADLKGEVESLVSADD